MLPILATTAASAASELVFNLADRFTKGPAKTAAAAAAAIPFSTLVDKATLAQRAQQLSGKLSHSSEVAAVVHAAGAAGPLSLQIGAGGDVALRLPDGSLKPIQLSEELRGVARELHQLRKLPVTPGLAVQPTSPVTVTL